jgi:hypothetical protein
MITRALSTWQPWAYAIMRLGKRVENRGNAAGRVPLNGYCGPLLLHASKRWPKSWKGQLQAIGELPQSALETLPGFLPGLSIEDRLRSQDVVPNEIYRTLGCVVGRVEVRGWICRTSPMRGGGGVNGWRLEEGDPALWRILEALTLDQRIWLAGPYAAVLDEVVEFETPIPCVGMQGIFTAPPDVAEACAAAKVRAPA